MTRNEGGRAREKRIRWAGDRGCVWGGGCEGGTEQEDLYWWRRSKEFRPTSREDELFGVIRGSECYKNDAVDFVRSGIREAWIDGSLESREAERL